SFLFSLFTHPPPAAIYTLSLHDALPIYPRRALEQPDAVADARREGARDLVDRRRAQGEGRAAAHARRARVRGGESPGVPRDLRSLSLQQRLLHVREGEGRRRRAAAPAPARPPPGGPDRHEPERHPGRLLLPRAGADRAAVRGAGPGDPRAALRRAGATRGYRPPSSSRMRTIASTPRSRFSIETRALGPWMPRVSLGGSQRGTKP